MFCPNCGTQNNDGVKFCANCGAGLTPAAQPAPAPAPAPAAVPVTPVAPAAPVAPAVPVAPVTAMPQQKTNVLCIVGFIASLVSIPLLGTTAIISLVLCIIGLIVAGKKNEKGKGQAIAGTIISAVLVLVWIVAIIIGVTDSRRSSRKKYDDDYPRRTTEYEETIRRTTRETTEETTEETTREETTKETTRETTEETAAPSQSRSDNDGYLTSVGNYRTGKVPLNSGKWLTFQEAGGHAQEVVEHEQAKDMKSGAIIGLFVLNIDKTPEEIGKAQMASMESAGARKVTGARVKIGGYDAVQCYGIYPDNTILVVWYFRGDDGDLRKVTVEFPSTDTSAFTIVENGYKLDR